MKITLGCSLKDGAETEIGGRTIRLNGGWYQGIDGGGSYNPARSPPWLTVTVNGIRFGLTTVDVAEEDVAAWRSENGAALGDGRLRLWVGDAATVLRRSSSFAS